MASKKIGALWQKTSKDGRRYLSGVLEGLSGDIYIAVFHNDRKQKDNEPDYTILRSEPMEKRATTPQGDFLSSPRQNTGEAEPGEPMNAPAEEIKVEDIPF